MKHWFLLGATAAALWFGSTAAVQGEPQIPGMTPQQKQAMTAVRDRYHPHHAEIARRLGARRSELANLIRADEIDKAAVKAKLDEILNVERERQQLFLDEIFEFKGLLRPEQWGPFRQKVLDRMLRDRRHGPRQDGQKSE